MRIQLLRLRENFDEGFIGSFSAFLASKYGWQSNMYWCNEHLPANKPGHQVYYVNDLLNLVYPSVIDPAKLTPFTKEFSFHPVFYRRWLQKLYVFWAVRFPLRKFVTSATLVVEDAPEGAGNWVILPGNHSHRVIDLKRQISSVFVKHEFNGDFLKADATVRLKYDFLPAPRVLEFDEDGLWFNEVVVSGLPINRLADESRKIMAMNLAESAMVKLYQKTLRSVDMHQYLCSLEQDLLVQINGLKSEVSTAEFEELLQFFQWLFKQIPIPDKGEKNLSLALSHGDFQAANILLEKNNIWLIDWEYSEFRSIYYDAFCMRVNSRFNNGLARRVDDFVCDLCHSVQFDFLPMPLVKERVEMVWVFLIEEFILKLKEVAAQGITKKTMNVLPWIREIRNINLKQIQS